ncbi:MAG: energy-coupling factor transporter ATPase, partial [Clostridiales Family XIII bacterium]|nr:energy-coupling factor transporter ATPase [Clostridiales Family XIII bacterium]
MESEKENIIQIEGLLFEYRTEDGDVIALDGVSLEITRGSFTSVIGRNGSGKSTLAKNINALLTPTAGCVLVGGYDTREDEYIWEIRRMAGMVFQNPDNQLVSAVVEDDVAFGPENLGLPREEIIDRIRVSLEATGMYGQRKMAPHLLSGGQKQRVAIAGVVAMKPDIIIFDEPTAMLDPEGRGEVLEIAARLHEEGVTVLLITHFMEETVGGDRIIIMDGGRVGMDGTPGEVFARADEIRALGLKLPFAVELAETLRARGAIPPGAPILREEALAAEILAELTGTVLLGCG